jgi:hypothetical protein
MRTESRAAAPLDAAMAAARNGDVRAARARAAMFSGHAKLALAVDAGSIVDAWMGFSTRPGLYNDPRRWVLPG